MSGGLLAYGLFALAFLVFLAIGTLAGAALVRVAQRGVLRVEPRARYRLLVWLSALPLLVSVGLMFSATLPSFLALYGPEFDHCLRHGGGHLHLCFVHLPSAALHSPVLLGLALFGGWVLFRSVRAAFRLKRRAGLLATLTRTGELDGITGAVVIESPTPLCLTVGISSPRILLSRELLDSWNRADLSAMLEHERAHVRRRDPARAVLTGLLCALHLPHAARTLASELDFAADQICDDEAALALGDRLLVASALIHFNAMAQPTTDRAPSSEPTQLTRRIEALLEDAAPERRLTRLRWALGAAAAVALLMAHELHHATETLLSALTH